MKYTCGLPKYSYSVTIEVYSDCTSYSLVSVKGHIVLEEGLAHYVFSQHCVIRHACVDLNRHLADQRKYSTLIFVGAPFESQLKYLRASVCDLLNVTAVSSQYPKICVD